MEKQACRQDKSAYDLSHSAVDTTSALNRTSAFSLDFAAIDSVLFSKSS